MRKRLFTEIRSENDVPVLGSVLSSFFSRYVTDDVDLDDEESLWPILAQIGLRHCNKHNKRFQRTPKKGIIPIGIASPNDSHAGFEPADDEPAPEAVVEFEEFLGTFKEQLTPRQLQVAEAALEGYSQREIAEKLGVGQVTINHEMKAIRARLEASLHEIA